MLTEKSITQQLLSHKLRFPEDLGRGGPGGAGGGGGPALFQKVGLQPSSEQGPAASEPEGGAASGDPEGEEGVTWEEGPHPRPPTSASSCRPIGGRQTVEVGLASAALEGRRQRRGLAEHQPCVERSCMLVN